MDEFVAFVLYFAFFLLFFSLLFSPIGGAFVAFLAVLFLLFFPFVLLGAMLGVLMHAAPKKEEDDE